jgi:large subunit ribosomal protein L31
VNHAIQPDYVTTEVLCSCGNTFQTRSTQAQMKLDICGACHPFYTGRQKFVDTAGRIQRFQEKYAWTAEAAAAKSTEKGAPKRAKTEPTEDDE